MMNNAIDKNEQIIKKYIESIRPEDSEIREQLDFGYSYDGMTVILYEIRPAWNNSAEIQYFDYAKVRYYKSKKQWNLYWMRASGKWVLYDPFPKSTSLERIVEIIREDKYSCFFG